MRGVLLFSVLTRGMQLAFLCFKMRPHLIHGYKPYVFLTPVAQCTRTECCFLHRKEHGIPIRSYSYALTAANEHGQYRMCVLYNIGKTPGADPGVGYLRGDDSCRRFRNVRLSSGRRVAGERISDRRCSRYCCCSCLMFSRQSTGSVRPSGRCQCASASQPSLRAADFSLAVSQIRRYAEKRRDVYTLSKTAIRPSIYGTSSSWSEPSHAHRLRPSWICLESIETTAEETLFAIELRGHFRCRRQRRFSPVSLRKLTYQ